jgi:c-di-GMP-binding flagellar brake protein YcgR
VDSQQPQLITPEVERRQCRRVKFVTQVQCEALERNEFMTARDVSTGGMFINARFPLPIESELSLIFRLNPKEPAINCRAKVVTSRVGQGMGIKFLDLSAETHQTLQKFVEEIT